MKETGLVPSCDVSSDIRLPQVHLVYQALGESEASVEPRVLSDPKGGWDPRAARAYRASLELQVK